MTLTSQGALAPKFPASVLNRERAVSIRFTKEPKALIIRLNDFLLKRFMESPGKYLKAERESRCLTLKEVSESTKIREHLLRAIEGDRYELISGPVYVKGFLEAYAGYLGLDPNDIILGYQKYLENQTLLKETEVKQRLTSSKKGVGLWLLFISAMILFFGVLIYCFSLKPVNHFLFSFEKKESKSTPSMPPFPPTQREVVKDE